jgi:thioredoxin reductase
MDFEVAIVGGGVAGLSAGLGLARCRRRVLICDDGRPRNAVSHGVHGFLTWDGASPAEFLRLGREQVLAYPTVTFRAVRVDRVERRETGFRLHLADGIEVSARKLLLTTGLVDELPEIQGFDRFWGHSAFVCPFCDGWEARDQRMVVIGSASTIYEFALELRQWAGELIVCADGAERLTVAQRAHFQRLNISIWDGRIERLEGEGRQLERIRFVDGRILETKVVFVVTTQRPRSSFAEELGCHVLEAGTVEVCPETCSAAPDVWIAGNAVAGLQMAIIAAAEGMKAAHSINEVLAAEEAGKPPDDGTSGAGGVISPGSTDAPAG